MPDPSPAEEVQSLPEKIQSLLDRLRGGDEAARVGLYAMAREWMVRLVRLMLTGYPGVRRWEQTDDVTQNALIRLDRALAVVRPETAKEFCGLAALQIRRELIDLARQYFGPQGHGANYHSGQAARGGEDTPPSDLDPSDSSHNPERLSRWTAFHDQIQALPEEERAAFEARWYDGMSNGEAAELLGISVSTLIRRYHAACQRLNDALGGDLPFR